MHNCNHDCFEESICMFDIFVTLCREGVVGISTIRMTRGRGRTFFIAEYVSCEILKNEIYW